MIYLDNAASSFPKPPEVINAMMECMKEYAGNPGRGSHALANQAARVIFQARQEIAKLFGIAHAEDVIFTQNTTESLNLAIQGFLKPGDHVITTMLEHNSVRRPLEYMKRKYQIEITYVSVDSKGLMNPQDIYSALKGNTKMIVASHASNLTGSIIDLHSIGEFAGKHGICFLVDAAQTAGVLDIDVHEMNIQMLAAPGHKSLYGPQGTGFLYVHPSIELEPLMYGGTGGNSESIDQPKVRPDRYESGTRNTVGIAGLLAGIQFIQKKGIANIRDHELQLTRKILHGLNQYERIKILGPDQLSLRAPVVSFVIDGLDSTELGFILDKYYQIAVRTGLHCTPLAHKASGSSDTGAARVSVGFFNTEEEIDIFLYAISEILKEM
ncbi:aminotransferase class V-fold PLP-dependent enzyme [Fodinisporobacter ferrooxydans]|uniref:cysteine desulfurase n=1 Tax=Fodinisporobacter ferrooxydans TaxID=2901836 RepID=A0ABY4CR73_9BACL|nr:aminotransferase class V-fold PLP-dependent enzyme [Alicyclobacillaceae bacterium MYW30-H2]